MEAGQGDLCVRVLSAIAWSDGQVSDEEMERVVDLVSQLDYVDGPRVQELLFIPTGFGPLDDIKALDRDTRVRLLHDAYMVAIQDGPVDGPEQTILSQIAGTVVDAPWEKVEACLAAYAAYEGLSRGLWGITHLG